MKLFSSPVSCFDKLVIENNIRSCLTCNGYILNVIRGQKCDDKNIWLFKFSKVYHCKVWHHFLTNAIFFFAQKGEISHDGNATSLIFVKQSSFPGNSPENEYKGIIALCYQPAFSLSFVCYFYRDYFCIVKFFLVKF